jgi:hypothetical protein
MTHTQWNGIPHAGPVEQCEWCNPHLRKRPRKSYWRRLWLAILGR